MQVSERYNIYIAGTRERLAGEIISIGATQSYTKDNDEANYGAGRAIDGNYSTSNYAVSRNGENPWLKISLDKVYCVQQVVRYGQGSVLQTWTCTENDCTGTGQYISIFNMKVSTEGATSRFSPTSDCSVGDTVTYLRKYRERYSWGSVSYLF